MKKHTHRQTKSYPVTLKRAASEDILEVKEERVYRSSVDVMHAFTRIHSNPVLDWTDGEEVAVNEVYDSIPVLPVIYQENWSFLCNVDSEEVMHELTRKLDAVSSYIDYVVDYERFSIRCEYIWTSYQGCFLINVYRDISYDQNVLLVELERKSGEAIPFASFFDFFVTSLPSYLCVSLIRPIEGKRPLMIESFIKPQKPALVNIEMLSAHLEKSNSEYIETRQESLLFLSHVTRNSENSALIVENFLDDTIDLLESALMDQDITTRHLAIRLLANLCQTEHEDFVSESRSCSFGQLVKDTVRETHSRVTEKYSTVINSVL